jgi:hypothetical protein
MFVTGAIMWWNRVLLRRLASAGLPPDRLGRLRPNDGNLAVTQERTGEPNSITTSQDSPNAKAPPFSALPLRSLKSLPSSTDDSSKGKCMAAASTV